MKILNEVKMTFLSKSFNESFSRVAVSGFISQLDPMVDELSDIKTAVSEAVTNCIVHAYKMQVGNRITSYNVCYTKLLRQKELTLQLKI